MNVLLFENGLSDPLMLTSCNLPAFTAVVVSSHHHASFHHEHSAH